MAKYSLIGLLVFIVGSMAVAADPKVEMTSFNYESKTSLVAEICGKVTGATTYPVYVQVNVDPKTKQVGRYSVVVLGERFCTTVITLTGQAELALFR